MSKLYVPRLFLPKEVRKQIEPCRPGVYLLGMGPDFTPGYVGRSDTCLRTRLSGHNHLYEFEYFIFKYADNPGDAFMLECEYWHVLQQTGVKVANKYHPAPPSSNGTRCPYCEFAGQMQEYIAA
ncbi:GIY-YIG nuclease family protein [Corallococcus sp. M7]